MPGLQKEDILLGISLCRNPKLANIFYRLELIEAYGTGLLKIQNAYEAAPAQPDLRISPNVFKVILPRLEQAPDYVRESPLSPEDEVLAYIKQHHSVTRKDIETLLNTSTSTATRILQTLLMKKRITRIGRGKQTKYM